MLDCAVVQQREALTESTIRRFGVQWTVYPDNPGYYGSTELLADFLGPLLPIEELRGARVAEIGSGSGRVVDMLLDAGVSSVTAVEPSDAFHVLRRNTAGRAGQIRYIQAVGEALPGVDEYEFVLSIGVLHHIPDPAPVVAAAYRALRPGGWFLIWLYGFEGNETYLRWVAAPLRFWTTRLPHPVLAAVAHGLNILLEPYVVACRWFPLPMREYVCRVLGRLERRQRQVIIYDQLNPSYAKYYKEDEVRELLEAQGFCDVRLHHRHGYSWTAAGQKPPTEGT